MAVIPADYVDGSAPAHTAARLNEHATQTNTNTTDIAVLAADVVARIAKAIGTAKGDIIVFSASGIPTRLAVGANGQVLTVDSATATGLKYATPEAGGGGGGGTLSRFVINADGFYELVEDGTVVDGEDYTIQVLRVDEIDLDVGLVLAAGEPLKVDLTAGGYQLYIGDGVTELGDLDPIGGGGLNDFADIVAVTTGTANGTTFLRGDGVFATPPGGGSGISAVVDDPTPQLGGDLDLNGNDVGAATAADLTKLHAITKSAAEINGVENGADVTDAANVGAVIHAATAKTTPVANDELALIDSAAANVLKRITYANLAAAVVALIVDGAPTTIDTLNELAAALGDDPNYAATITAALGTKQPLDATLTALAGAATAANKLAYFSGVDTVSLADFTAAARALLDDADAAAMRVTLGARGIAPRVNSAASNATPALNAAYEGTVLTAQAAAITAFSLSGAFVAEQMHMIRIKDDGSARAITWTSSVIVPADGITLPTTTVVGKTHRIGCIYDEVVGKLIAVAVGSY